MKYKKILRDCSALLLCLSGILGAVITLFSCTQKKENLTGKWNLVYNWSPRKEIDTEYEVIVVFTSNTFVALQTREDRTDTTTGTYLILGDSVFMKTLTPRKAYYNGILETDSTMSGIMFPAEPTQIHPPPTGYWRASKIDQKFTDRQQ